MNEEIKKKIEEEATEFAEWILSESYAPYNYKWKQKFAYISDSKTTQQLYELFKQSK